MVYNCSTIELKEDKYQKYNKPPTQQRYSAAFCANAGEKEVSEEEDSTHHNFTFLVRIPIFLVLFCLSLLVVVFG